jgi:hypothetical protein
MDTTKLAEPRRVAEVHLARPSERIAAWQTLRDQRGCGKRSSRTPIPLEAVVLVGGRCNIRLTFTEVLKNCRI